MSGSTAEWQLWKNLKNRNCLLMKWEWQLLRGPKKSAEAQVALQARLMKCLNFKNWYNSTDALYCRDNDFRYDVPEGTAWRFPKSQCVCWWYGKPLANKMFNIWSLKCYLNHMLHSDFNFMNRLKFLHQQDLLELLLDFHMINRNMMKQDSAVIKWYLDLRLMTSLRL